VALPQRLWYGPAEARGRQNNPSHERILLVAPTRGPKTDIGKMRSPLNAIAVLGLAIALAAPAQPASAAHYTVSRLDATFELVPDANGELRDVAVRLELDYKMEGAAKSGGYKHVGRQPIRGLRVTDGSGKPLPFKKAKDDGYRISWSFPTIIEGEQQVVVQFVIVGLRTDLRRECHLVFDWTRDWPDPVTNATFRFVLPSGEDVRVVSAEPVGGELTDYHGRPAFMVWRDELTGAPFALLLETSDPGTVDQLMAWGRFLIEKTLITVLAPILLVVLLLGALVLVRMLSRKQASDPVRIIEEADGYWNPGDDQ
jgi:hypothetical protein